MNPPDSKPTGIPTTVAHDGMKVTTFRKDYENIRANHNLIVFHSAHNVIIEAGNMKIYAKEDSKEETQIIDQNSKDSAQNQLITFLSKINCVAKISWNHCLIDDTVIEKLVNINIRELICFTDTNVLASKSKFIHFLAQNSKKVKITRVQLAQDLLTDDIVCHFLEPVSLLGSWNGVLQPTMITDAFLNQYNVSNLAKDDRTMILSGLLNTKITMKGIEDFAKKIYKNKKGHINVDYGIIGYDQLEHLEKYKDKQPKICWRDELVNWNGQNTYRATLLDSTTGFCSDDPFKFHRVSVSLERSSRGIVKDAQVPLSMLYENNTTFAIFETLSKAVNMKSEYSSIIPQQYEFENIRYAIVSIVKRHDVYCIADQLMFDHAGPTKNGPIILAEHVYIYLGPCLQSIIVS